MIEVGYLAALLGGVLTLVSPCGALLLPSFFAYAFAGPGVLLARTGVFFLGLAATLVPLGAGVSLASSLVYGHRDTVILVAGVTLVVLGVVQALGGGFASRRLTAVRGRVEGRTGHGHVLALGAVYGFAGFCSGPILGSVLTVAAVDPRPLRGAALLAVHALGMTVPLFLMALAWERFDLGRRRWLRGRAFSVGRLELHTTSLLSGALFVAIGVAFVLTRGTASAGSLLGAETSLELEATAQEWVHDVAGTVPDGLVLGLVGLVAAIVLAVRLRRPDDADEG